MIVNISSFVSFFSVLLTVVIATTYVRPYQGNVSYCAETGGPLIFESIVNYSIINDDFVQYAWIRYTKKPELEVEVLRFNYYQGELTIDNEETFSRYGDFGMKIDPVTDYHEAKFRGAILDMGKTVPAVKYIVTFIKDQPSLASDSLFVEEEELDNETVKLKCGNVSSLGTPPINIIWIAANGSEIQSTFQDQQFNIIVPKKEMQNTSFTCMVEEEEGGNWECVKDRTEWTQQRVGRKIDKDDEDDGDTKTGGGKNINLIIVIIACVSIFLVGGLLICIFKKKCRKKPKIDVLNRESTVIDTYKPDIGMADEDITRKSQPVANTTSTLIN